MSLKFLLFFFLINVLPGLALAFRLTRDRHGIGLIDRLIIGLILSPLILVLISFVEEFFRVPQSAPVLGANLALLGVANIFLLVRYFPRKEHYALRLSWLKGFAYALFAALVIFRVLPALDLLAPILHDPIAHSEWLKYLNTNHFTTTEQWYPQGLAYYLNYYATFFDFAYPRIILIGTNFLVSLFPVSLFYLGTLAFRSKDRWMLLPLIMFVLAARMRQPNNFYYTAGKNSMILAFTVTPLLLYMAASVKDRRDYILAAMLVFASFIIHYPTGILLIIIFFTINLPHVFDFGKKKILIGQTVNYVTGLAVMAALGIVSLVKILPVYLNHPLVGGTEGGSGYEFAWTHIYYDFIKWEMDIFGMTAMLAFIAALSAFAFVKDENKKFPAKILMSYAAIYLLGWLITMKNPTVAEFFNLEVRHFFVFILVIFISWYAYYFLDRTVLNLKRQAVIGLTVVMLLGILFLSDGWQEYRRYLTMQEKFQTVKTEDMDAFDFINSNINDDRKFLIQMAAGHYVAGADSGVWIPSFTDKQVEASWLEFSSPRAFDVYDLYLSLAKNGSDAETISALYCGHGVGYVFFGSEQVHSDNMDEETLANSDYFENIFSNGATIFRIKPLSCPNDAAGLG
ncbi:MAG: hypothetical protein IBX61_00855 [Thermoleophilia bacterium]|nr:hypothetical protein [Thermoleophilia bacterium]